MERVLPVGHVLRWSAWEVRKGEHRPRALHKRDTWTCPECRHVFRRERKACPIRYEGYATVGQVRYDLACGECRQRIDLLSPADRATARKRPDDVGVRIPGVDAG